MSSIAPQSVSESMRFCVCVWSSLSVTNNVFHNIFIALAFYSSCINGYSGSIVLKYI